MTEPDRQELTRILRENEQPIWELNHEMQKCFKHIGRTITHDINGSGISRLAVYINELLLLLLEMFREQRVPLTKSLTSARRTTELFFSALAVNVSEQWTLESMAECCGLGVTRFVHYCRQITNLTPVQYLNQLRVETASKLLKKAPEKSITDIAFECGFSSSQYFATVFRKKFKCSPLAYRKSR